MLLLVKTSSEQSFGSALLLSVSGASPQAGSERLPSCADRAKAPWWERLGGAVRALASAANRRLARFRIVQDANAVAPEAAPRTVAMREGEIVRIEARAIVSQVEVRRGTVWLTESPARGDVVLHAGERFVCSGAWLCVLQGIEDASVTLR